MAKFRPLHHYNQCMGENRRKTFSTARGRGGVDIFTTCRLGYVLSYGVPSLCVCTKVVLYFGHCTTTINVWERIGEKHLAQLVGEGTCQPDIFTTCRLGYDAKLWDMSHLSVCFVALVIQGGAMAKFWPLHHYNQCMGENRRKTFSTARGRGGVST